MPSSVDWLSRNSFSLRSELSVEVTSVTVWPTLIWPLNSKVSPVGLRTSFTVTGNLSPRLWVVPVRVWPLTARLATKRSLRSEPFSRGIADVEHRRGDVLALAGFLEDDVGIAVHQAVDGGEIPDFVGAGAAFGESFIWAKAEIRRGRHQADQAEQKRAHMRFLERQNQRAASRSMAVESEPALH